MMSEEVADQKIATVRQSRFSVLPDAASNSSHVISHRCQRKKQFNSRRHNAKVLDKQEYGIDHS